MRSERVKGCGQLCDGRLRLFVTTLRFLLLQLETVLCVQLLLLELLQLLLLLFRQAPELGELVFRGCHVWVLDNAVGNVYGAKAERLMLRTLELEVVARLFFFLAKWVWRSRPAAAMVFGGGEVGSVVVTHLAWALSWRPLVG